MVKLLRKKYYRLYQIFLWCWEIPCQIYYENMIAKPRYIDDRRLLKFGFKSYSQNDEDGIIREIFNRIGTTNKYFVEFGVQNGIECNTHLLLVSGWGGLWIEADKKHWISANRRFSRCVDERKLKIVNEFVDAENINNILRDNNIQKEIDFLSIDVDGNDIWIWRAIEATSPRVISVEYNSVFHPPLGVAIPYRPDRVWNRTNYMGSSLSALVSVAEEKGYSLVGCNFTGINAFFVRNDLVGSKFCSPYTAENHFEPARYGMKFFGGHRSDTGEWEKF